LREQLRRVPDWLVVFIAFIVIAVAIHAQRQNLQFNLLGGGDGYTAGLPSKIFSAKLSPWNPYVQLGQYTFANTQFQPFYPPGLIPMALFPNTFGYNLFILWHYAAAGLFFYLFARNLKLNAYASFMGGLTFMCSGFLLAHKGHQAMMSTAVWLPLILMFCDRYARRFRVAEAVYAGAALAMSILGGFPQITVYSLLVIVPYLTFRCFEAHASKTARLRAAAVGIAVMGGFAALLSSLQLAAVAETLPHVTRQKIPLEMFSEDSLPAYHLLALFIPNALGGFHGIPTYSWNMNVVELYPYSGLIPVALAIFCFLYLRRRRSDVWFWVLTAVIATVLSLGLEPVQKALYRVPVYNLFRAPARHLYELNFAVCVLTALACDRLFAQRAATRALHRSLRWTATVFATLFLAVVGIAQSVRWAADKLTSASTSGLDQIRVSPVFTLASVKPFLVRNLDFEHPTILYPAIAALLTVAVLVAFRYIPRRVTMVLLPIIFFGDVWSVYRTIYDNPDTRPLYEGRRLRPEIPFLYRDQRFDQTHFRVFPVDPAVGHTYPLLNMMYGLSAVNDYTPMWLKRYQTVTGFPLNGAASPDLLTQHKLLSAMSVQYLLTREPGAGAILRNTTGSAASSVSPLPLPAINCVALNCGSTTFPQPGTMRLQAPGGPPVAIIHIPVPLKPRTVYQFEFEARTTAADTEPKPLMLDLYWVEPDRPPYDSPEQDSSVPFLRRDFMKYTVAINSGSAPPPNALARIYTQSRTPIELRNLSLGIAQTSAVTAYSEVGRTGDGLMIFKNANAAPRFRFATELLPAGDLTDAQALLLQPSFDPIRQATVEGLTQRTIVQPGSIVSERIDNNSMSWTVKTGPRAFFVVADSWFPGWTATVDGRETKIHIVNGFLRGIFVEGAGTHTIRMRFWPRSLTIGLAGTLLALVVFGGSVLHTRGRADSEEVAETAPDAEPAVALTSARQAPFHEREIGSRVGKTRARLSLSGNDLMALLGVGVAALLAFLFYQDSLSVPIIHDAHGYYRVASEIWKNGLFSRFELSELRTYAYPAVLGGMLKVAAVTGVSERIAVFAIQFLVHVAAAVFLRYAMIQASIRRWAAETVFYAVLLQPFVLIYSAYFLTESLSLSLGVLVMACAIALFGNTRHAIVLAAAGSLLAGFMVEIRPANIFIIPAWVTSVAVAVYLSRISRLRASAIAAVVLVSMCLPMLPQIRNNIVYHRKATPLIAVDLGKRLQHIGIQLSKYATTVAPGMNPSVTYENPFAYDDALAASNPLKWYVRYPDRGIATLGLHVFNLLDQDLPTPYSVNLVPAYYAVVSPLNLAMVGLGFAGVLAGWRRRSKFSRVELASFHVVLLMATLHAGLHSTVCVEARFGLALLLPIYAAAAVYMVFLVRWGSRRERVAIAVAVIIFATGGAALSRWVRSKSPAIRDAIELQDPERHKAAQRLIASSRPGTVSFSTLNDWMLLNARVAPDGSAVLASASAEPSILQHPVILEKGVDYRVDSR
jgi:hypothetical protein